MRSLGKDNPWAQAWIPLSVLAKTCETIIDLGLTGTELESHVASGRRWLAPWMPPVPASAWISGGGHRPGPS